MKIKIYEYKNCDTCRKALKYLDQRQLPYQKFPIVDSPPSPTEIKQMLGHLKDRGQGLKNLFNTSGELYRELKIADRLRQGLSEKEAIDLLAANGKLIKRPFVLSDTSGTVGFKSEVWEEIF